MLYVHQQKLINQSPDRHLLSWGTGTGKTAAAIGLIDRKQVSGVLVICPKSLKDNWKREILKFSRNPAPWRISTKETFRRDWETYPVYEAIIIDECFIHGTEISTPTGLKQINNIKIGDKVINAIGYGIVKKISKRIVNEVYVIKFSNGETVKVTGNHLFFTTNGWVKAMDLKGEDVLHISSVHSIMSKSINTNTRAYAKMSELRQISNLWFKRNENKVLLSELCSKIYYESEKCEDEDKQSKQRELQKKPGESKESLNKNDEFQSDEVRKNEEKIKRYIKKNWMETGFPWRERAGITITSEDIISGAWRKLARRISCTYKNKKREWLSNMLQDRCGKSEKEDSCRNRWPFTLLFKKTRTRQKKREVINFVRVESIQVQKQRDNGEFKQGFKVYNLEVSGHPSYVVNNMLVHNCHYHAGIKSRMFKNTLKYIKKHDIRYRYLLTATPYLSTPWNIFCLGHLLGRDWKYPDYKKHFFYSVRMGHRMIPVARKGIEGEIARIVQNLGSAVKLEDCIDLPESIYMTEEFEWTSEQEEAIDNLMDFVPIVRFTKVHQIAGGTLKGDEYTDSRVFKSEKLDRLLDIVSEHKKIAVVCRYNAEIDHIKSLIPNRQIYVIRGDVKDRQAVVDNINSSDDCVVLLQAQCSEGYNMPTVPVMIFYSHDFSLKNWIQMQGRIQRISAPQKCVYISMFVKDSIDEDVYKCIKNKENFDIEIYASKAA